MANILIIDDDYLMCQALSLVVRQKGHQATCVFTLADGLAKNQDISFDVIFLDVNMPDGNGLDCIRKLAGIPTTPEIIIITGASDLHGAELAIKSGAWDYLVKGASVKEIAFSLQRALQYREQKQVDYATAGVNDFSLDGIIGTSHCLQECMTQVAQAAISDTSLLIAGNTGTGKELFARALHRLSPRNKRKFVVVDCASIADNLIEETLFGHEEGAFANADQAREGLISQAHNGTLFLDEVGEMPLSLQKVFLRVLEEHRFRPIGGNCEQESNFRLVAATNCDLEEKVQKGLFRADLLFRLSAFVVKLSDLSERPEDIPLLARYHADRICAHYAIKAKDFSPEFTTMLNMYRWPGNTRELVNSLERAIAVARKEPVLFPKHLPIQLRVEVAKKAIHNEETSLDTDLPNLHSFPLMQDYSD